MPNEEHGMMTAKAKGLSPNRRGLAPLELVLGLPILLMLMALMVNFGTVACWKVRALTVAREKAFASRSPRDGAANSEFAYWPTSASAGTQGGQTVSAADDSRLQMAVTRGPTLSGYSVNGTLLDPSQGFSNGTSGLTRKYPMLGSMGAYRLGADSFLLDNAWQVQDMGLSRDNLVLRLDVIYVLPDSPTLSSAYERALRAFAAYLPDLDPLFCTVDPEYPGLFERYGLRSGRTWYPTLRVDDICTLDTALVQARVDDLIQRIDEDDDDNGRRLTSVPKTVAQRFLRMYQFVQRIVQSSPTPDQTLLTELQKKIDALNEFLGTLK